MDKRLGLAIAISMVILFGWWKLFPPTPPVAPPAVVKPAVTAPAQQGGTAAAPRAPTDPSSATAAPPAVKRPEERITLETADARFVFSSHGASLRQVWLKDSKFFHKKGDPSSAEQLIDTTTATTAPLRITFPKADFKLSDDPDWTVQRPASDTVVFRTETDEVVVEKRFRVPGHRFRVEAEISVSNKTDKPAAHSLTVHMYGKQDPAKKGGSFLDYASADVAAMVCFDGNKVHRNDIESLRTEPSDHVGDVRWVAADEKFFTVALVSGPTEGGTSRKCGLRALDEWTGEVFVELAPRTVTPGQRASYPFVAYTGPKYTQELETITVGGQPAGLEKVVDVALAVLSRPLLYLLKQFHKFTGNWGVAIILLTIFVKLVTFYPSQRAMISGKKMQRLQPELAKLRKKYDNDRQRLGVEMMALHKQHGVSMVGGCLPSLIQMPIWIALFSTLNYAAELHRAPFLYIVDLSAKDPLYLAPLLMGAVMYLQMRMAPAGADPQQQKMMAIMMPVMFTGFSLFLPAGLAIYTLTSYLIGILQQVFVNWQFDRQYGPAAATAKS